ncbi:hypothetical protein O9Z70_00430 [Devosia sp. YIM 151766]|uniref:hypothetical protein n=1 Tax=Devosia sp. YIM 151766 TaxID=3017325 RepID=UPI00255C688D|nr:hypothetical protein [Devosia sp. YIM 151766]WIY53047.1 hypothetical protein O9Z70_00430 [Devosia sp. YIM 151766]
MIIQQLQQMAQVELQACGGVQLAPQLLDGAMRLEERMKNPSLWRVMLLLAMIRFRVPLA